MLRHYTDITIAVIVDRDEHAALVEWSKAHKKPLSVILREAIGNYTGIEIMKRAKAGRKSKQ